MWCRLPTVFSSPADLCSASCRWSPRWAGRTCLPGGRICNMSPACRHVATIKIIYIATRTVNETSQKCSQYLDKASRLLLFRPSTCWKRLLVIWLWKLLWNYISNIYITMSIYLLALRCLCGGFHGSMPPQNHVGSSMIILFIWN